jgi:hypothetical protein
VVYKPTVVIPISESTEGEEGWLHIRTRRWWTSHTLGGFYTTGYMKDGFRESVKRTRMFQIYARVDFFPL